MTRYWVESKDQTFVKDYGTLSLAENMSKKIGKNINKKLGTNLVNTVRNFFIMLNVLQRIHLKLLQKK